MSSIVIAKFMSPNYAIPTLYTAPKAGLLETGHQWDQKYFPGKKSIGVNYMLRPT